MDQNFSIVVHAITISFCGFSQLKKKFMSYLMYKSIAVKGLHLRISHIIHTYCMTYIFVTWNKASVYWESRFHF